MNDLHHALRADLEPSIQVAIGGVMEHQVAIGGAMEHRVVIEQAKGALMAGYGVTPDSAFAILASVSQQADGLKVHQVAERLLTRLSSWDGGPIGPGVLDTCLAQIAD